MATGLEKCCWDRFNRNKQLIGYGEREEWIKEDGKMLSLGDWERMWNQSRLMGGGKKNQCCFRSIAFEVLVEHLHGDL